MALTLTEQSGLLRSLTYRVAAPESGGADVLPRARSDVESFGFDSERTDSAGAPSVKDL